MEGIEMLVGNEATSNIFESSTGVVLDLSDNKDGRSAWGAIPVHADTPADALNAMYEYLTELYGELDVCWRCEARVSMPIDDRQLVVFRVRLANGRQLRIHFDISCLRPKNPDETP